MRRVIVAASMALVAGLIGLSLALVLVRPSARVAAVMAASGHLARPVSGPAQVQTVVAGHPSVTSTSTALDHPPHGSGPEAVPSGPLPSTLPASLMAHLGPIPSGWQASVHSISSGGIERDYLVLRPSVLPAGDQVPTVVLLAGRDMNPDQILHASGLAPALAETGPAVLVVPAGWHDSWDAGDCCSAAYASGVNDVSFISSVVRSVVASTPGTSMSDLYAVGFSNGGRMAYRLGCEMPGDWRGFVAVEAVPVLACSAMTPTDVTIVAQQADPLLTVSTGAPKHVQGFVEPTVADTVSHVMALDGCPASPVVVSPSGTVSPASGPAQAATRSVRAVRSTSAGPAVAAPGIGFGASIERTWSCAGGHSVRYVWYPGGGHNWRAAGPGTPGATDYVLQMLGRGPLANLPSHRGA